VESRSIDMCKGNHQLLHGSKASTSLMVFGSVFSVLLICFGGVTLVTSDTLRVCAIQRSLARGHDKSCDPLHGTKMRLILKEGDALRIRD
jgi:hypothetical protein